MMKHWMGLIACLVLGQAQAASFDCVKAQTKGTRIERLICVDGVLSKLDDDLDVAYKAALQDEKQADTIRQAQKQWLQERNGCQISCQDSVACVGPAFRRLLACVEQAYRKRLQELPRPPAAKPKPRFRVTEGKGWTVCESYVRFLNAQPDNEPPPLCHLKLSPDLKEPDWEELDIHSHLQLVYTLEKLTSPTRHDRPVDNFDHWKSVFEHQISTGEASPRLRRVRLSLVAGSPVETILAYEPDRHACDKDVKKQGYAHEGARTSLFIWNEQDQKIEEYVSYIAFVLPRELLLFQGKPFTFWPWWGSVDAKARNIEGRIDVNHFTFTSEAGEPYANLRRCQIGFELPSEITERMIK